MALLTGAGTCADAFYSQAFFSKSARPTCSGTLFMGGTGPLAISPALYKKVPYDSIRDFAPITLIGTTPMVLVVHPSAPARSVREFVAHAKANPGKINYASAGAGSILHLSMEMFRSQAGISIAHVPYKALLQRLRIFLADTWPPCSPTYLAAQPAGGDALASGEIGAGAEEEPGQAALRLRRQCLEPALERRGTAEQFAEHIRKETAKWGEVVKRAGVKID